MKTDKILLDHGSGGKMSHRLTADLMVPVFNNSILSQLNDGGIITIGDKRIAFSTDTYVVDPIFFPGGNIGDLAINGTVNDLAMCGAVPMYLSVGLIIEENLLIKDLEKIIKTMGDAAKKAGVTVITGDTKVVPKGTADKLFINTSGMGIIPETIDVGGHLAKSGDKIILSGTIADHGITVLTQREGMSFDSTLKSDTAPLNQMVQEMFAVSSNIHVLRDPTRGGVGTTLNEIAVSSEVGIRIYEEKIPVKNEVAGVCELLGFDPMYIANEGKLLAFVSEDDADTVLSVMKKNKFGQDACIIGNVTSENRKKVFMKTRIGGERILDMLTGEQLPRIC